MTRPASYSFPLRLWAAFRGLLPSRPGLPLAGLAAAVATFLILGGRLLDVGAADLGIAGIFSTDEQLAGELVRAMIRHGDLGLSHFFSYGPLDLYAARALLRPYGLLHPIREEAILVVLRLVSLLAGAGCLVLTFSLGRRLWNEATGAIAAALLGLSATTLAWSTTAHPDMLQLLFLLVGIRFTTELAVRPGRTPLVAASAFASLAFATKYGGLLLLPVIWLAAGVGRCRMPGRQTDAPAQRRAWAWLQDVVTSLVVFGAIFLLVDPSVLGEPRRFISQARVEAELAHAGHLFTTVSDPLGWANLLTSPDLLGPVALVLAFAGLVIVTVVDLRADLKTLKGASEGMEKSQDSPGARAARRLPLEAWTLGYLIVLFVWIGDRQPRYALPVLPGLALFAAAAIVWLANRTPVPALTTALLLAAASITPALKLVSYEQTQARRLLSPPVAARVAAGRWLVTHVAPETPILRDAYSYVPSNFARVQETFGLTPSQIGSFQPQIIVTDADLRDRFRDSASAPSYRDGPAAYMEIESTYQSLEAGNLPCYPFLEQFGPVRIYGSLAAPKAGSNC